MVLNVISGIFSIHGILLITLGVAGGIAIGAMPGLSATMGVALLIPITFTMAPAHGLMLLGSIYIGAIYGGSISAILLRIPGTPASIATTLDGFPMAQNGEADKALKVSIASSFAGGIISAIALLLIAPPLAKIALAFGPAEYFWVTLFGLSIIVALSSNNLIKGFISAVIGLFIGVIGMDPLIGVSRFDFGNVNLLGGISPIILLIGLYSIPQALEMLESGEINKGMSAVKLQKHASFREIWEEFCKFWPTYFRSGIIGTIIGIIPGAGANIASYVGYNEAKRWSKHPEKFGTGISEGITGSEAANNGVTGGSLIPLLTLGIPGNGVTAVLIGGLLIQGLRPGPMLFSENADIVYIFMGSILFGNFIMLFLGYYGASIFANVVKIPKTIVAPTVIVLSMVGTYAINNSSFDVGIMLIIGIIGYIMRNLNIDSAPAVLALILGPMAESNVRRALLISEGNIGILFTGLINWIFIIATVASLIFGFSTFIRERIK